MGEIPQSYKQVLHSLQQIQKYNPKVLIFYPMESSNPGGKGRGKHKGKSGIMSKNKYEVFTLIHS